MIGPAHDAPGVAALPTYWALIGDVVGSRRVADRARLQARLERLLGDLNRASGPELASRWSLTLGDEFQALFRSPHALPGAAERLCHGLAGTGLRFGVGWGELATPLRRRAVGMDGPCFHRARAAVEAARRGRRLVAVEPAGPAADRAADVWNLALVVIAARTPRQVSAIDAYREAGSQLAAARRLGISQAAVSSALARGRHAEVSAVLPHVAALLAAVSGP
jgi:hypothetical protein